MEMEGYTARSESRCALRLRLVDLVVSIEVAVEVCCAIREMEDYTARSESRCALRLRLVDLVVSIKVAVEVCCCFTLLSC
jgi:hypothetical protein